MDPKTEPPKAPETPNPTPTPASIEADKVEKAPVFRTDLGESLPAQKDTLNPDRAK